MIEASPHLRKQQAALLSGSEELEETDMGWKRPCKYLPRCEVIWCEDIRFVPKGRSSTFLPNSFVYLTLC
jgi:NADH dehydrogenase [ubiquinone] 1 alpha subcomplex assembly factor 7